MSRPAAPDRVLVTGGAGFVGTNLAHSLMSQGERVRVIDSLARPGSERNIQWLREQCPALEFVQADIRDPVALREALAGIGHVFHLAAQVAVTTSLLDPRTDFDVNAAGTLNVLEAARACTHPPSLVFTSTNKVYGVLPHVEVEACGTRYEPVDEHLRRYGIAESQPLDFHSPYGCSKGAADQYVLDYARSFGLRTTVLRMSCIYGPHQHGNEDQGWVAHFARCALDEEPIAIYGDGLQVRDLLFVDDLVAAFQCARRDIDALSGRAFNIGGGSGNTASVREVLDLLEQLTGRRPCTSFAEWRTGDQRYYVSDISRFSTATQWHPVTSVADGIVALCDWLAQSTRGSLPEGSTYAAAEAQP